MDNPINRVTTRIKRMLMLLATKTPLSKTGKGAERKGSAPPNPIQSLANAVFAYIVALGGKTVK